MDDDDLVQAYTPPGLLPVQSSKSNKSSSGKNTVKCNTAWTEGSEIKDSNVSPKPAGEIVALKILLEILSWTVVINLDPRHWESSWDAAKERPGLIRRLLLLLRTVDRLSD